MVIYPNLASKQNKTKKNPPKKTNKQNRQKFEIASFLYLLQNISKNEFRIHLPTRFN